MRNEEKNKFKDFIKNLRKNDGGLSLEEYLTEESGAYSSDTGSTEIRNSGESNKFKNSKFFFGVLTLLGIVGLIIGISVSKDGETEEKNSIVTVATPTVRPQPTPKPKPTPTPDLRNGPYGISISNFEEFRECIEKITETHKASVLLWNSQHEKSWDDSAMAMNYFETMLFETGGSDEILECGITFKDFYKDYVLKFNQLVRICADAKESVIISQERCGTAIEEEKIAADQLELRLDEILTWWEKVISN